MRHLIFKENPNNKYKIALLIKEMSFNKELLTTHYINPLIKLGVKETDLIGLSLKYSDTNKITAKVAKDHLKNILTTCKKLEVTTLLVADSNYFKFLIGVKKVEPHHGYVMNCSIKGYETIKVILSINYQALFYNPSIQEKLNISLDTLAKNLKGIVPNLGYDVIHSEYYPDTYEDIKQALYSLHQYSTLTCDFETFGLKHYNCGIGTVAFAWDQHNGLSFCIDYNAFTEEFEGTYGEQKENNKIRKLLKNFFTSYKGKLIWHNISFDATVAIAQLWMKDITDIYGLYRGLDIMTNNFDCTQIITYLATNSCSGNHLSLKYNAHEYVGNYAQDEIEDIRKIPKKELLTYNLTDCLATWYVYNKNYPILIQENQEEPYLGILKESLITIIQMQLTGLPMCMEEVKKAKIKLEEIKTKHLKAIMLSPLVGQTLNKLTDKFIEKDFKDRRDKAKNPTKIKPKEFQNVHLEFNPGSGTQVAVLLYEVMCLPIIATTDTNLPSTDEKTLTALINHTKIKNYKEIISNILGLSKVDKILSTFIPAFEQAQLSKEGTYYLFGSFKLGGTKSGRLSSASPNLQQIPSNSTYAKIIKKCFKPASGELFVSSDYDSLEDRINSLLTKDPNKIKVYTDGYDGHSLRAYSYFTEQMPDIRQVSDSIRCFKTNVNGTPVCFTEKDTINYQGKLFTGIEFYEKVSCNKI